MQNGYTESMQTIVFGATTQKDTAPYMFIADDRGHHDGYDGPFPPSDGGGDINSIRELVFLLVCGGSAVFSDTSANANAIPWFRF